MDYNENMVLALGYLAQRFFYRIAEFFRHWYVKSVKIYSNFVLNQLERIDYYFAWKITLKNLFQPLYKDYSVIGYILGFVFRSMRFLVATFVYGAVFAVAAAFYILWLLLPIFLVYKTFVQ